MGHGVSGESKAESRLCRNSAGGGRRLGGISRIGEGSKLVGLSLLVVQRESKLEGRVQAVLLGSESVAGQAGR